MSSNTYDLPAARAELTQLGPEAAVPIANKLGLAYFAGSALRIGGLAYVMHGPVHLRPADVTDAYDGFDQRFRTDLHKSRYTPFGLFGRSNPADKTSPEALVGFGQVTSASLSYRIKVHGDPTKEIQDAESQVSIIEAAADYESVETERFLIWNGPNLVARAPQLPLWSARRSWNDFAPAAAAPQLRTAEFGYEAIRNRIRRSSLGHRDHYDHQMRRLAAGMEYTSIAIGTKPINT